MVDNKFVKIFFVMICSLIAIYFYSKAKFGKTNLNVSYIPKVTSIRYDFRIIILTFNRPASLYRLLKSINAAEYDSDNVKLEVWIDRSKNGSVDNPTLKVARSFSFRHGHYKLNIRDKRVGLLGQWLLAWKPDFSSKEIAVILEDDLTVSKYFYRYLKAVHRKYDKRSDVNGYTLQASQMTFAINTNTIVKCPKNSSVYLYPVVGSWGFSPNNKNWNHFLKWYSSPAGYKNTKPYMPGHTATKWYKLFERAKKYNTMWTMWHMYHAWKFNEFTLYYNFQGKEGLATNYREKGVHFNKTKGATNPLLTKWKTGYERDLPDNLVYIDIAGKLL